MKDAYNRNINYLRISITDLCNLRCKYCMPEEGIKKGNHLDQLRFEEYAMIVKACVELGVKKVRLTGGEPLVKKQLLNLAAAIGSNKSIEDFALTTNGQTLESQLEDLWQAGIRRINVSIDTFDPVKYEELTRGGDVKTVLRAIDKAIARGFKVKLNAVYMKGINDGEIETFIDFSKSRKIDVRFIELMPIGESVELYDQLFRPLDDLLDEHDLIPVDGTDPHSPASYYTTMDGQGSIGLIRPISCSFCEQCNRIRLTSQGKLKLCLHSDSEYDLKVILRDDQISDKVEALKVFVGELIMEKPEKHRLEEGITSSKPMVEIGG